MRAKGSECVTVVCRCGWLTPLVNVLVTGPGNAAVIDFIQLPSS